MITNIPTIEEVYKISYLVKHGWTYEFSIGYWESDESSVVTPDLNEAYNVQLAKERSE